MINAWWDTEPEWIKAVRGEEIGGNLAIDDIIPRAKPHLGDDPDWSRVIYPNPPSHDFCTFLIISELMRREHGCTEPLKVTLLLHNGALGKYDFGTVGILDGRAGVPDLPPSYSNAMIAGVVRPAIEMIGAINEPDMHVPVDVAKIARYCEYPYFIRTLVEASKAGFEIPRWRNLPMVSVFNFLRGEKPVVITLRETWLQPERNSQVEEWIKAADVIARDHPVIFLRDTNIANLPLGKHRTWPLASTDAKVRHALYQQAHCNLMTSAGPMSWLNFSSAPYLIFKQFIPELYNATPSWEHGGPKGWWEQSHLREGDQYPWAASNQRLTWRDDTFENIMKEWERWQT